MKASELRIGNYLHDGEDRLCRVEELRNDERYEELEDEEDNDNIDAPAIEEAITTLPNKPIPLTEDWLLKFGFGKILAWFIELPNNSKLELTINNDNSTIQYYCYVRNHRTAIEFDDYSLLRKDLQHVHQLQNLYFALTGTELTLTPSPG